MRGDRFIGRENALAVIRRELSDVRDSRSGRFLLVHGRRRVGKSRLVDEFLQRDAPRCVFFAASRQAPSQELEAFRRAVAESTLSIAEVAAAGISFDSWDAALQLIASVAQPDDPEVIVIDELPYLLDGDPSLEATVQKAWDRHLERAPILLILIGSDMAVMSALSDYSRPLFGRPTRQLRLEPFTPTELGRMIGLAGVELLDAYLIVGGFPLIARSWREGEPLWDFVERALLDPTSALIVDGERMLAAELPAELQARDVLTAIGAGEVTFNRIGNRSGISQTSLQRALRVLVEDKRLVGQLRPMSAKPSRGSRYYIGDAYLRFWMRFISRYFGELERGRGRVVLEKVRSEWPTYRGGAIEPFIRASIESLLPDDRFGNARYVGNYWTRGGEIEVDLVGVRERPPSSVAFAGSIKWREDRPFSVADEQALRHQANNLPGAGSRTRMVGVSRRGFQETSLDLALGPDDILRAWDFIESDSGTSG